MHPTNTLQREAVYNDIHHSMLTYCMHPYLYLYINTYRYYLYLLIYRYYNDLSFKEISEKTGVSINTSLGRMRYALINLEI